MKVLSDSRYRELLDAEATIERIDEDDRKHYKDVSKVEKRLAREHSTEITKLTEKHEDKILELGRQHRSEIRDLDKKIEEANDKAAKAQKEADKKADARIEKAEADLRAANSKTEKELAGRESKVETAELNLAAREERVKAREEAVAEAEKEFSSKVTRHAKEVADARTEGLEIGEKRGYANGSADMARTIAEQTSSANGKVAEMGNKALDAVVEAAKQTPQQPTVNVLSVPTATPAPNQAQKQK